MENNILNGCKAKTENAGTVTIQQSESGIKLYKHQMDAYEKMTEKIIVKKKYPFKGLLVLPTGGGKTMTAARWVAENILDKGIKVLWIAHRHELLNQARVTFTNDLAYKDIFKEKDSINYRLISGIHDKTVNVKQADDIIFSSKDSVRNEQSFELLKENWLKYQQELFLVIDEAHHATAKTYRKLIERIESVVPKLRMLGLTATPFRTLKKEQGYLSKVFPNDIIYEIDLKQLIRNGILSEPIFEEVKTNIDLTEDMSKEQIEELLKGTKFEIDSIGGDTAKKIADNRERNSLIVSKYIENKDKYGKTIVFAINKENVIALNALFREKGIRSDYVMSDVRDAMGLHNISSKDNSEKIKRFRKGGDIDVLINVNILTEGTDVPDVQSVFLTRPTFSKILMTQMMGRGLRGEAAGGTKEAYIVTFIDDWDSNIAWVNPEKLYIDDYPFDDLDKETQKYILRFIAISKVEEFSVLSDKTIDPKRKAEIESVDFINRIPKGFYKFNYPIENGDETIDKTCQILVYDNLETAYKNLVDSVPSMFGNIRSEYEEPENISDDDLFNYSNNCEEQFFADVERYPAYRIEDIDDLLRYYFYSGETPKYYVFPDREKYDIKSIAQYIINQDMGPRAEDEYMKQKWNLEEDGWQAFFDKTWKNFRREIHLAKERIMHPEDYIIDVKPQITFEERSFENLSLIDIRKENPDYEHWLRNQVFEKAKDSDGFYHSAISDYKSKNRIDFEIDHIKPLSLGGKTNLDNLQLLTRWENRQKGNKYQISSNNDETTASQPNFIMPIENVYYIVGRGLEISGTIQSGEISVGDVVMIGDSLKSKVIDIFDGRFRLNVAQTNKRVALIFDLKRKDIKNIKNDWIITK